MKVVKIYVKKCVLGVRGLLRSICTPKYSYFLYSKEPALQHGFNDANDKFIGDLEAVITPQKCQILVWICYLLYF